ncbi:lysozyme inhibitor LprI family protein [Microbulbifer sp. CnH-101-G]|uniref:lysozyme inhibitor LprI family protein n=1 Tax=Microbulbifer sp. CnH-101-G TaxID=3243393 RepID=UPI0040398B3E
MIEVHIKKLGLRFTHLQPEGFIQNLNSYGWFQAGARTNLICHARWGWADALYVSAVAMKVILLLSGLTISPSLFAIDYNWSKWQEQCNQRERTQLELNQCAHQQFLSSDNHLNKVYQQVLDSLTPQQQKKLRAEQRLWLQARDPDCKVAANNEALGGSIWPMLYELCRAEKTDVRIRELRKWISH